MGTRIAFNATFEDAKKIALAYPGVPEHCGRPMLNHSDTSWACANQRPDFTCPVRATDAPTDEEKSNAIWV